MPPVTTLQAMGPPVLDASVVAAAVGAMFAVAIVFGLVPLAQARRINIEATLRDGGRQLGSAAGGRASRWLVIGQIAISLALLVSALLLIRSQQKLSRLDTGLAIAELDQFRVGLRGEAFTNPVRRQQFYEQLEDELRQLPGVADVAAMSFLAVQPPFGYLGFTQEGDGLEIAESPKRSTLRAVSPRIFQVSGIRLLEGRLLDENDTAGKPDVTVVSASLAHKYWPDGSPLGKRVRVEGNNAQWLEIVGVVSDTMGLGNQPQAVDSFYCTIAQRPPLGLGMSFVMRMRGPFLPFETLQRAVAKIDPQMQAFFHISLSELYSQSSWQSRYMMVLVGAFAALALLLALGGIYAVNSFRVTQRVPEFGVRMALGADSAAVQRQVLGENIRLVALGLPAGLVLALLAGFGLRGFLFEVVPFDPAAYAAGAVAMIAAGLLASFMPARRASRVDPIVALRAE
jgi:predicted permease